MPRIRITRVQTMSEHSALRPSRFFFFDNALALEAFVEASSDLANLDRSMFQVVFQIISTQTDTVVFNKPVYGFFGGRTSFYLLLGSTSVAPTNAFTFGLTTNFDEFATGKGIFGFRALAKALQVQQIDGKEVLVALEDPDCFDRSDTWWFRVAPGARSSVAVDDLINTGIWPGEPGRSLRDKNYPGDDLPFKEGPFG